jgi:glutathione S-transferase
MPADLLTAVVTILAILVYFYMGIRVGQMRGKHNVKAPTMTGPAEFECAVRVHYNTLEAMVVFLPLLWLATFYFTPAFAMLSWLPAALGLVWVIGRILYMTGYMADPEKRSLGFLISAVAQILLLILAIIGIVKVWMAISA